jgi:hypothetical protein
MPKAYILSGVEGRSSRASRLALVIGQLGFEPDVISSSLVKHSTAENWKTQYGFKEGFKIEYCSRSQDILNESSKGDVIFATEPWHSLCFKGTLEANKGKFNKAPVIEAWIDYQNSFSKYRVFSNRFAMYTTIARENIVSPTWEWILGTIPIDVKEVPNMHNPAVEVMTDPYSMDHLNLSGEGIPLVAPDWGAWSETVVHGLTGFLYRTPKGREKALLAAQNLPSKIILDIISSNYCEENALKDLCGFVDRVVESSQ